MSTEDEILQEKKKRLKYLKLEEARKGVSTPAEINVEIERLEAETQALEVTQTKSYDSAYNPATEFIKRLNNKITTLYAEIEKIEQSKISGEIPTEERHRLVSLKKRKYYFEDNRDFEDSLLSETSIEKAKKCFERANEISFMVERIRADQSDPYIDDTIYDHLVDVQHYLDISYNHGLSNDARVCWRLSQILDELGNTLRALKYCMKAVILSEDNDNIYDTLLGICRIASKYPNNHQEICKKIVALLEDQTHPLRPEIREEIKRIIASGEQNDFI